MLIDIHTHAFEFADPRQAKICTIIQAKDLVADLDRLGIDKAILLPLVHHECCQMIQTNEDVLNIVARYPGRFIPFCNLDPRYCYNNEKVDFGPVLQHYKDLGCRGIGEMCAALPWDDDRVLNLLGHLEKAGLPILFHLGRERGTYGLVDTLGLPKLEKVLQRFPRLQFLGHSMGFWSAISGDVTEETWLGYPKGPVTPGGRLPELMRRYPNLWGDISAGSGNNALVRDPEFGCRFMEEFQDRLLFGTDICRFKQVVPQVDTLRNALAAGKISRTAYEKITHLNAERLLGL